MIQASGHHRFSSWNTTQIWFPVGVCGGVKGNRRSQVTKGQVLPKMDMYLRNRRGERILLRACSARARVEVSL
jgi:hypothetical protein